MSVDNEEKVRCNQIKRSFTLFDVYLYVIIIFFLVKYPPPKMKVYKSLPRLVFDGRSTDDLHLGKSRDNANCILSCISKDYNLSLAENVMNEWYV